MISRVHTNLAAIAELASTASVAAWVGGHAALGAFAARIAFRDLPRDIAATTMTTIFRSFDRLIAVALLVLTLAFLLRLATRGIATNADRLATLAALGLATTGLVELMWVHPMIERLFGEGQTIGPRFATWHRLSERLGHLEVILGITLFTGLIWGRTQQQVCKE